MRQLFIGRDIVVALKMISDCCGSIFSRFEQM